MKINKMKKEIILTTAIVFVGLFTSCEKIQVKQSNNHVYEYISSSCEVKVITIDSCQYIIAQTGTQNGGLSIIHKQNCNHCNKK